MKVPSPSILWLLNSPGRSLQYDKKTCNTTGSLTSQDDIIKSFDTFGGACLGIVITSRFPGVNKVDIALREVCDLDQPVRLARTDRRAELVDVACRDAWIDANAARSASERTAIDRMGDRSCPRVEGHGNSEGER